jgi:hypothetical protein
MSIALKNEVADLKARLSALEKKHADTAESLAYLHGHVLGMQKDPTIEPPEKLRTLSLPEKRKSA